MKRKWIIFLEFSCFFYEPVDVGSLISGSSAFSKSSLYIWKFSVHILLKRSLKDFEHYLVSMWNKCSYTVVWTFLWHYFLWDRNENWPFPVLWPLLSFPNLLAYCVQHFHSIILSEIKQIRKNCITSTNFVVMLLKAHSTWLHTPGCLTLGEWPHHCGYPGY